MAIEVAEELALQRLDRAFVLEPGELGAAAVIGQRNHRRGGGKRGRHDGAGLEERAAIGLFHGHFPSRTGKNRSTSNLPAWRAGAPTALMLRPPCLPQW